MHGGEAGEGNALTGRSTEIWIVKQENKQQGGEVIRALLKSSAWRKEAKSSFFFNLLKIKEVLFIQDKNVQKVLHIVQIVNGVKYRTYVLD